MATISERDYTQLKREDMLDDYLARSKRRKGALVASALRTRSVSMRDILVRGAVDVTTYSEELKRLVLSDRLDDHHILDSVLLGELGRLVLLQNLLEDDLSYGEALLIKAHELSDPRRMPKYLRTVLVQHFIATGQLDKASSSLDAWPDVDNYDYGYLRAELNNPFIFDTPETADEWLTAFNRVFTENDIAPVEVSCSDKSSAFDRLQISPQAREAYGEAAMANDANPLVSIVMTAYRPHSEHLETSVRSILDQTWQNLEVIIVDDCSGPEFTELFERIKVIDSRIRVIHASKNQGTYVARNIGYAASRGDFITGQDDDDWSHPQRIALQVEYMRKNPDAIGCRVLGIRSDENLGRVRVGYRPTTENASSLLIRREGFTATGGFLAARKAADTEFFYRVSRITGRPVGLLKQPLSIIRILGNSLSRQEFAPGWKHSTRRSFRSSYEYWHANAPSEELKLSEGAAPKVHIPRRFEIDRHLRETQFDVVFAGDWQQFGGPQKSMLEEIQALKQAGYKVGVMNLEAARFMTRQNQKPLVPAIQQLINDGFVEEVHYDEPLKIRLLILRYPPILQFFTHEISELQIDSLIILANQAPSELDGSDIRYLVDDCNRNAERAFGVKPMWVPQGPQVRDFLAHYLDSSTLADFDMPGILDLEEWWHDRLWYRSKIPVVGRHSRDNRMKWPSSREVMDAVYPGDGRFDVRIMGGAKAALSVLGESQAPAGWTVYKTDELAVPYFLWTLDYFVFYQHPEAVEAFGRAVLEAIASGTVVILPPHFERVFGEAAIYCEPWEVADVIDYLHSDFTSYELQLERAKAVLAERFSYSSYHTRIEALIAHTQQEEQFDYE